jgi:hypothetical protein
MRLYLLLVLVFCLYFSNACAQQKLQGVVFENDTRVPLAGIRIQNTRTKLGTETDIKGKFIIDAQANDVLVLQGFAYLPDTVFLTDLKPREIFMLPGKTMLKQVDVHNHEIKTGSFQDTSKSKSPFEYHGQSMIYQRDANGNLKGGVTFRVWSNHSAERRRKKLEQDRHDEEIRLQIDQVFSPKNLTKYLPLKPEELSSFKSRYIPSVKAFTANNFNLLAYLSSCYKEFVKLPPEKRVNDKLMN